MEYRPPAFLQPQQFGAIDRLPQTLDQVFQRAMQVKQAQAAMAMQNQQMGSNRLQTAPFGFSPEQVTPEAIAEATKASEIQIRPFDPNASPLMNQNSVGQELSPLAQGIMNYINMQKASAALGMRKTASDIGKVESEGLKLGQESRQLNLMNDMIDPGMQGNGGGLIANLRQARTLGNMSPSQESEYLSRNQAAHMALVNDMAKSGQNVLAMDQRAAAREAGMKASANLTEGGQAQQLARAGQAALGQLELLQQASDNVSRFGKQFLNTPYLKLKQQNDPKAQALVVAINSARAEYASVLNRGLAPGLEQLEEARKAIPDSITAAQLPSVIRQLKLNVGETVKGQMTPATRGGAEKALNETKQSQALTNFHYNPKTGQKIGWNGSRWVEAR